MTTRLFAMLFVLLTLCTTLLSASHPKENALWIEVKEKGGHATTIALTEPIARLLLESDEHKVHFAKEGEEDAITREMVKSVLDGKEELIEVQTEEGAEVRLFMADLKMPARKGDGGRLVLEIFKSGSRTLRMSLPEIEIEASDEEEGTFIETSIGWKGFLPFLAEEGGAVYIKSTEDDTEVWLYTE